MTNVGLELLVGSTWVGALLCLVLGWWRERIAPWLSLLAMVATAVGLGLAWSGGDLTLGRLVLPIHLDALSLLFMLNVVVVGLIAVGYAFDYMRDVHHSPVAYGLLLAFVGSMIGTLLADSAVLLFVFWEGMLIASSLLLYGWGEGERARQVTLVYFLYTQAGSLLLLVGLLWVDGQAGGGSLFETVNMLRTAGPRGLMAMIWLMIAGLSVKMALVPLHGWLPDAHAVAPMPVTLLLAGAMLSMGTYGLVRLPLALVPPGQWARVQPVLLAVSLLSMVYGALLCLAQSDAKRFVAYSSVSQMGYVLYGLASGTSLGTQGALVHIVDHGLLKTLLFVCVGAIALRRGTRSLDRLRGMWRDEPWLVGALAVGALGLAGLPPLAGFSSEWEILGGGLVAGWGAWGYVAFLAPLLTLIYAVTLLTRIGWGSAEAANAASGARHRIPRSVLVAMIALAVLVVAVGLFPGAELALGRNSLSILQWVAP